MRQNACLVYFGLSSSVLPGRYEATIFTPQTFRTHGIRMGGQVVGKSLSRLYLKNGNVGN